MLKIFSLFLNLSVCSLSLLSEGCRSSFPDDSLQTPAGTIIALQYSPDETKLAVADHTGAFFVVDAKTGQVLNQWVLPYSAEDLSHGHYTIAFSTDGMTVYACANLDYFSADAQGNIQKLVSKNEVSSWELKEAHPKAPKFVWPTYDSCEQAFVGDLFLSWDLGSSILVYDAQTNQERFRLIGDQSFHSGGTVIYRGWRASYVELTAPTDIGNELTDIWDITTQQKIFERANVVIYDALPQQNLILFGTSLDEQTQLFLWDVKSGQVVHTFQFANPFHLTFDVRAALSDDGTRVAAAGWAGRDLKLTLWDVTSEDPKSTRDLPTEDRIYLKSVRFLPSRNDRVLTSTGGYGDTQLWNAETGEVVENFVLKGSQALGRIAGLEMFALSRDGNQLISMNPLVQGEIVFWNLGP